MKRFVLTAMGLGFLYIVAVSCNMSQNNQQNVQTNDLDTAVSYEMPADNVTEPYDPDKFALEAGRGELRKEYFGIKLADLKKDADSRGFLK